MSSLKSYTKQEVAYHDGGKTLSELEKQAKTATGAALEKIKSQQALYKKDCWIIIHGIVYDVSGFLNQHPGGPDAILASAGKDATVDFEDIFHSASAREALRPMRVGKLDTFTGDIDKVYKKEEKNTPSESYASLFPIFIMALAILYYIYQI